MISAQNDTLRMWVDLKNLETNELRNIIPDSNFTTSSKDTTLTGEIIEICDGFHSHHIGYVLGILKLRPATTDSTFQIVFQDNEQIEPLTEGQQVTLKVKPYDPDDKIFSRTTGLTCTTITGYNLYRLKKIKKTGANNK